MWASLLTANHYKLQNLARSTCCLSTNKNFPGGRVLGSTPGFKIFFKYSSSPVQYNRVQHCQPALNLALPVRCMNRREWERRRNKFEFFLFFAGTDPQKDFHLEQKKFSAFLRDDDNDDDDDHAVKAMTTTTTTRTATIHSEICVTAWDQFFT